MKRTPRGLARRPLWRRLKGTESAKPKKVAREITLLALHMGCGHLAHAVCRLAGEGPARRSLPDSARDSVPVRSSC